MRFKVGLWPWQRVPVQAGKDTCGAWLEGIWRWVGLPGSEWGSREAGGLRRVGDTSHPEGPVD